LWCSDPFGQGLVESGCAAAGIDPGDVAVGSGQDSVERCIEELVDDHGSAAARELVRISRTQPAATTSDDRNPICE
jgi:hypothetical protein